MYLIRGDAATVFRLAADMDECARAITADTARGFSILLTEAVMKLVHSYPLPNNQWRFLFSLLQIRLASKMDEAQALQVMRAEPRYSVWYHAGMERAEHVDMQFSVVLGRSPMAFAGWRVSGDAARVLEFGSRLYALADRMVQSLMKGDTVEDMDRWMRTETDLGADEHMLAYMRAALLDVIDRRGFIQT